MAEKKYYTDEEINLIITAAIASTDAAKCKSFDDWQRNVIKRAASIQRAKFFHDGGTMRNVLESTKIVATIKKMEFEESSKRYVISFIAAKGDGKLETIRTPRTDSREGEAMKNDIERMKSIAGTDARVCLYKSNEVPSEEAIKEARKQGKNIPPTGFRNIVWVEFME